MTTAIITGLLQLVQKLFKFFRSRVDATAEAAIAKHAAAVLRMTKIGKELLEHVEAMDDDELDDFLKELGK